MTNSVCFRRIWQSGNLVKKGEENDTQDNLGMTTSKKMVVKPSHKLMRKTLMV